jgi:hypothetical protein
MARAPVDYEHGRLYRLGAKPVQGLLAGLIGGPFAVGSEAFSPGAAELRGGYASGSRYFGMYTGCCGSLRLPQ